MSLFKMPKNWNEQETFDNQVRKNLIKYWIFFLSMNVIIIATVIIWPSEKILSAYTLIGTILVSLQIPGSVNNIKKRSAMAVGHNPYSVEHYMSHLLQTSIGIFMVVFPIILKFAFPSIF